MGLYRALIPLLIVLVGANATAASRSPAAVRAFRAEHPCPTTGRTRGACPGWQVDHVIPLCAGGEDRPANMQWIAVDDHKWKTRIDVRECRKLKLNAAQPARERDEQRPYVPH